MKKRNFIRFKPQTPTVIQIKLNTTDRQSEFIPAIVIDQNHNSKSCLLHANDLKEEILKTLEWKEEDGVITPCKIIRLTPLDKDSYRLVFSF